MDNIDREGMRRLTRSSSPLSGEEWARLYAGHRAFLEEGMPFGSWRTFVADGGHTLAVYKSPTKTGQKQLDLLGKKLEKIELSGSDLRWSNLTRTFWGRVDLSRADMRSSMAIDSWFEEVDFTEADLTLADFSRSRFIRCTFEGARLDCADFEHCRFERCGFFGASLDGSRFPGAEFVDVLLL